MTAEFNLDFRSGKPETQFQQLNVDNTFSSIYDFETSFQNARTVVQNNGAAESHAAGTGAPSLDAGVSIFGPVEFFDSESGMDKSNSHSFENGAQYAETPIMPVTVETAPASSVAEKTEESIHVPDDETEQQNMDTREGSSTTTNGTRAVLIQGGTTETKAQHQGGEAGSTVEESVYANDQAIDSPAVEPFSEENARDLIKQFADDRYAVRQHAMESIIRMGPAALPLLREISQTKQELEVKYRVKTAIEAIDQEQYNRVLNKYKNQYEMMDGLFLAAGLDFNEDHFSIDPKGRLIRSILIDSPPKTLSKSDRAQFEKMILSGDELREDERFETVQEETLDSEDYNKLMVVGLSTRTREVYARALSGTGDPDDARKGLKLLQEQMRISEDFEPRDTFLDTAFRLGGSKDQDFRKAFSDAGFDPETIRPITYGRLFFF